MVQSPHQRRRRTLRAPDAESVAEGAVTHVGADEFVTVEVKGGPPGSVAHVSVGQPATCELTLDDAGDGAIQLRAQAMPARIEVWIGGRVLLTGSVPPTENQSRCRS